MMAAFDHTGERFGRLLVMERAPKSRRDIRWVCLCDCGRTTQVKGGHLRRGVTRSCGCLSRDAAAASGLARRTPEEPGAELVFKRCSRCRQAKPITQFHRNRARYDGRANYCHDCAANRAPRPYSPSSQSSIYVRQKNLRKRGDFDADSKQYFYVLSADPCCYCGHPSNSIDHIDPGGSSHWTNLSAACSECNSSKQRRSLLRHLLSERFRTEKDFVEEQLRLLRAPR